MKKIVTMILLSALTLTATSCTTNSEIEALKKENEELKQAMSENSPTPSATNNEDSSNNQELALNQPLTVQTEWGSYQITITGAEIKDWRERSMGDITNLNLLLNYKVDNIDFSNEIYPGCFIDSSSFYVYDDNKTLLDIASSSYDTQSADVVLPGYNGNFNLCYDLKKDNVEYVDVIIHRTNSNYQDIILGQLRVNIQ